MSLIPNFFLRELKIIDPTYYVVYDPEIRTFDIMQDIKERVRRKDGSYEWTITSLLLDFFNHPNDEALTRLRWRKRLGIRLNLIEHPKRHMAWIKRINAENKARKSKLAIDMIAEGYKKIHQHNTSMTLDYGGGIHDKGSDKNSNPQLS